MKLERVFGPFVATMLLTLVVWIYMYARRIPFILRGNLVHGVARGVDRVCGAAFGIAGSLRLRLLLLLHWGSR